MARMSLSIDVEHEDESYRSPSPILLSPNQGGITLIQTSLNSPGSLDEDEVALSYLSEQDDLSKYKSKLSKLYSNKPLIIVQTGIITLFSRKALLEGQTLISLNGIIKSLLKQDIGEFLVPFYEERILKKGMWKLREEIVDDDGETLLIGLADIWNYFYRELLPALQVIFCSVLPYKNLSIKERTLIAFRDEMLLKTQIRGNILLLSRLKQRQTQASIYTNRPTDDGVVSALQQMFLVLLVLYHALLENGNKCTLVDMPIKPSVWTPSAKQYLELETLAAQIITPLMTARGVYYDGKVTPLTPTTKIITKARSSGNLRLDELSADRATLTLPRMITPKHGRQRSQPVGLIKEFFTAGSYISDNRLSSSTNSRARAQSQSDIL